MLRRLEEVTIEIIQKCNSECIFCSSLSDDKSRYFMPFSKVSEIVAFCVEKGVKNVCVSGGEPFMHEDIYKIIFDIVAHDVRATIYTSGNVCDFDGIVQIFDGKINKNMLRFIINYPSADELEYKVLVNKEIDILKVDDIILKLLSLGFLVEAHIVPNEINVKSLYNTLSHLKVLGVSRVSLLRIVFQGRAHCNKDVLMIKDNGFFEEIVEKSINNLCDKYFSVRLGVPFGKISGFKGDCLAGWNKLIFRYDGHVFPCEAFKEAPNNKDYILGNVYVNDLEGIWNNTSVHDRIASLKNFKSKFVEVCPAQLLY